MSEQALTTPGTGTVTEVAHPLVQHKLSLMRDRRTSTGEFRQLLREIGTLLAYEVTRDLPLTTREIDTPLARMQAPVLEGKKLCLVSILRAGNGLLDFDPFQLDLFVLGIGELGQRRHQAGVDVGHERLRVLLIHDHVLHHGADRRRADPNPRAGPRQGDRRAGPRAAPDRGASGRRGMIQGRSGSRPEGKKAALGEDKPRGDHRRMPSVPLIAIVDDDDSLRNSLENLIRSFGFRAQAFPSAEAFLSWRQARDTACLILDVRMPGMNGLDLP